MYEFQVAVGYERTEHKQWLDTKQQTQTSTENVLQNKYGHRN